MSTIRTKVGLAMLGLLGGGLLAIVPASPAAATPTCDWVAGYAGAWVPYHRATNSVDCNMIRGNVSEAVRKLQHSMNLCYGENLVEDGNFGGLTYEALKRTQRKAGTRDDGQYGPNTRKAMLHQPINPGPCVRVP